MSKTDNFLISEFNEKNQTSHSQFSLQVQPLEKDLFISYTLVYTGANAINGKVLLWKENGEDLNNKDKVNGFYVSKSDLAPEKVVKINQYL